MPCFKYSLQKTASKRYCKALSLQYLLDWEEFLSGVGKVSYISLWSSHRDQISSLPPHYGQRIGYYQVQAKKRAKKRKEAMKKSLFPQRV